MMMDTLVVVLYILVQVYLNLALIQGHMSVRKHNYLTKFSIDLNGIWYAIDILWCEECHIHFTLSVEHSRERTLLI